MQISSWWPERPPLLGWERPQPFAREDQPAAERSHVIPQRLTIAQAFERDGGVECLLVAATIWVIQRFGRGRRDQEHQGDSDGFHGSSLMRISQCAAVFVPASSTSSPSP